MTTAQVVEMSVTVNNTPIQDYTHPDDNTQHTYEMTHGLEPFIASHGDGLAHATGVHERNTVPYARFALKKRHGFNAKAREKNMQRHRLVRKPVRDIRDAR